AERRGCERARAKRGRRRRRRGHPGVAYLSTVADPADVLRALLGTSHLGAAMPFMLGDTWMAPAPPSSSTLGARALAAASLGTPIHRLALLIGMAPAGDAEGAPVPRERHPAVQPLGP
ncbi:MAG: hypothetical protein AAFN13_17945, partial [Bacteroidota bacterium]